MDQFIIITIIFSFTIIILVAIVFMFLIYKFNNLNKSAVIEPTKFPLLDGENILFTSEKMKSSRKEGSGTIHYDFNGSYVIITNKRIVISQGPAWMKLSLFFKKEYFDNVISNELLIEKFKYNSIVAIFNEIKDDGDKLTIYFSGQGREFKLMRVISDFLNVKLLARLWNFTEEDKQAILKYISENK